MSIANRVRRLEGRREHFDLAVLMRYARGEGPRPCDCEDCRRIVADLAAKAREWRRREAEQRGER